MEIFLKPEAWLALLTLTFFEVVLGIDNIIFISIVSNRLPPELRARTRNMGLLLAMGVRILLLLTITWVMQFKNPLFDIPHWISEDGSISGRDLILIFGGLFLIAKSTREINHQIAGWNHSTARTPSSASSHIQSRRCTCSSSWQRTARAISGRCRARAGGNSTTGRLTPNDGPPQPWTWEILEFFKIDKRPARGDRALLTRPPCGMLSGWSTRADGMSDTIQEVTGYREP